MNRLIAVVLGALAAVPTPAGCPPESALRERLAKVDLAQASRTVRFGRPVPTELHGKALGRVSKPFAVREGNKVTGVIVAPVPAEKIWRAINDEEHHALGFLPVKFSTVVDGRPRGKDRVLFQYYRRAGLGRWWASRIFINSDVHKATKGKIWEVHWHDWMDEVDRSKPPIADVVDDIRAIESSVGAWMLVPLGESCTLIEEYSEADPGGAMGLIHGLVAAGAIRDTLKGIVAMAEQHRCEPAAAVSFLGPDGKPPAGASAKKATAGGH